jgi:hypothetical protein
MERRLNPPPQPASSSAAWVALFIAVVAFIFGLSGLIISLTRTSDGALGEGRFLSLSDNTTQQVLGDNIWTNVAFGTTLHHGSDWHHEHHQSSRVRALSHGTFAFYFSVQTGLVDWMNATNVTACRPCHRKVEIRGVRQRHGTGTMHELRPSYTVGEFDERFLSKLFLVTVEPNDVVVMQFKSRCIYLALRPVGDWHYHNSYATSATLAIQ